MGIHYKKTTCITVGTKQKLSHTEKLNIKIENNENRTREFTKITRITYRQKLTTHIDYLCATISFRISLLKQLSYYISENI